MNLQETLLQHKRNAERLFCASVLVQPDLVKHDCGWLRPETFNTEKYKLYWQSVRDGKDSTQSAIELKIYGELLSAQSELISSLEYMAFAKTITEDFYYIKAADTLPDIVKRISTRDREGLTLAIKKLVDERPESGIKIKTAVDIGMNFVELLGADNLSIRTGLTPLDKATGGLSYSALHLLAARTSMGKSTLAFQISRNLAAQNMKTVYFSIEQSATSLWAKAACGLSGVDWKKVKTNTLTQIEHSKIVDATGVLMDRYGSKLLIDDRSRMTSEDIWQVVAQEKPEAIIVDHLSLLSDRADTEVKRLGNITWTGKQIAKEFGIVAIYLQQLSRGVTQRQDKRPVLTDLRDSGETEQNADTVTFIHRDDYYGDSGNEESDLWSETSLIIAKDRDGQRNIEAMVYYNTKDQWFYSEQEGYEKGMRL